MWQFSQQEEVLPMVITIELEGGVRLDLVQSTNSVDEEIIKEFQRQSLEMNEELQASREVYEAIGIEVTNQGETLDKIEDMAEVSKDNVESAVYELHQADRENAKNRKLKCTMWCSGAGGVIGGVGGAGVGVAIGSATVAGAPVAGAAGGVFGASSGAAVGWAVGNFLGALLEAHENRVIDSKLVAMQTYESPKWVPNEFSDKCMHCNSNIGKRYLNPKHHCRLCGGLYCGECSKYRLDIKYPGVESPKRERICIRCKEQLVDIQQGKSTKLSGKTVMKRDK